MKVRSLPLFSALAAILTLGLPTPAALAEKAKTNLIPEGSFEILERGVPEGWKMPDPNWYKNFRGSVAIKTEKGSRFLRLECPVLNTLLGASYTIPLTEDMKRLRLSYRVRAEIKETAPNDGSGVGVAILPWWDNTEAMSTKFAGAEFITKSTKGWVSKKVDLDVPKGVSALTLTAGLKQTDGVADFDDITVEVLR